MRAFEQFRGQQANTPHLIWQASDTVFPYECDVCRRVFAKGGRRWLGSRVSVMHQSHYKSRVVCEDCHAGIDPHRQPAPRLSERRTTL